MLEYNVQIKKVTLRNFRKFERLTFDFETESSYQAFSGRNSTGKTTVLEAINIALSDNSSKFNTIVESDFYSDAPIEIEVEFTEPFYCVYEGEESYNRLIPCTKYKKIISRRVRKERNSFFSPLYKIDVDCTPDDFNPSASEYRTLKNRIAEYTPSKSIIVRSFGYHDDGTPFYTIESAPDQRTLFNFNDFKYFQKHLFPKVFYIDKNRERELSIDYNTTFAKLMEELDWKYRKQLFGAPDDTRESLIAAYQDVHSQIRQLDASTGKLIDPIIEGMINRLKLDFRLLRPQLYFFDMFSPYSSSIFGAHKETQQIIPVSSYGSGFNILTALYFIVELALQSKESVVILIDEPEMHLHPDLQRNLKSHLKDSGFQAIVATHSHLFLDFDSPPNNWSFEDIDRQTCKVAQCDQIDLGNLQFSLLGNSLDDLYIPDYIVLVEGKYDKLVLSSCFRLQGKGKFIFAILDCGGYPGIPDKAAKYEAAMDSIVNATERYKSLIKRGLCGVVDGDVSKDKVKAWREKHDLSGDDLIHLDAGEPCMEYLYPETLVKKCVKDTILTDGSRLEEKSKEEILSIIFTDDEAKQGAWIQKTNRVSKQRLSKFVADNLTDSMFLSDECTRLREVTDKLLG